MSCSAVISPPAKPRHLVYPRVSSLVPFCLQYIPYSSVILFIHKTLAIISVTTTSIESAESANFWANNYHYACPCIHIITTGLLQQHPRRTPRSWYPLTTVCTKCCPPGYMHWGAAMATSQRDFYPHARNSHVIPRLKPLSYNARVISHFAPIQFN